MGSSKTILDLEDSSRTKIVALALKTSSLGLGLEATLKIC